MQPGPKRRGRRPHRTWPQRLLITFNVGLIMVSLMAAGGLSYFFWKWGQVPRIALSHVLAVPSEDALVPQNFLLVGDDSRTVIDPGDPTFDRFGPDEDGQRSDTIMILRVDPQSEQAALLSIPRDLWVPIAGRGFQERVNAAYAYDGAEGLIQTIQENFGIPINHYVEVNFTGFQGLVNAIGGVPIYFEHPARDGNSGLLVEDAGCVVLDGEQALGFARSRHYQYFDGERWRSDPTGDLGRVARQQEFIRHALRQAVNRGARNPIVLQQLVDVAVQNVTIDSGLTARDVLTLGTRFRNADPEKLHTYYVPGTPATIDDKSVLLIDAEQAEPIFDLFRGLTPVSGPVEVVPSDVAVMILNGTGETGLASRVAGEIGGLGFGVTGTGDASFDHDRTTIRYNPGQLPAAQALAATLAAGADLVADDFGDGGPLELIVGPDWAGLAEADPGAAEGAEAEPLPGLPAEQALPTPPTTYGIVPPVDNACA